MVKGVDTPADVKVGEVMEAPHQGADIEVRPVAQVVETTSVEAILAAGAPALPAEFEDSFSLTAWYASLAYRQPYEERDPEHITRKLLRKTFMAKTAADVFEHVKPQGLQMLIPNQPGATSGPVRIVDLYVAESDKKGGVPCFMVLDVVNLRTGDIVTTTTGAQELQAQMLTFLALGVWPIEGQFKRIDAKDKGDRYMMRFFPVD
jgi:hypothetical protein